LEKHAAALKNIPDFPGMYIDFMVIPSGNRMYSGQSKRLSYRINSNHESVQHRKGHLTLHYAYRNLAERNFYVLPVKDRQLGSGPIFNILEHWISLIFRTLQAGDLQKNLAPETLKQLSPEALDMGANVRLPIAQSFQFADFPRSPVSYALKNSSDPVRRAYGEAKMLRHVMSDQARQTSIRQAYLNGDIFKNEFVKEIWWSKGSDYLFQLGQVKLQVSRMHIDRLKRKQFECSVISRKKVSLILSVRSEAIIRRHGSRIRPLD
jgi:hypothetical protein